MKLDFRNLPEKLNHERLALFLAMLKEFSESGALNLTEVEDRFPAGGAEDYFDFALKFGDGFTRLGGLMGNIKSDPSRTDVAIRIVQVQPTEVMKGILIESRMGWGEGVRFTFTLGTETVWQYLLTGLTAGDLQFRDVRIGIQQSITWLNNKGLERYNT